MDDFPDYLFLPSNQYMRGYVLGLYEIFGMTVLHPDAVMGYYDGVGDRESMYRLRLQYKPGKIFNALPDPESLIFREHDIMSFGPINPFGPMNPQSIYVCDPLMVMRTTVVLRLVQFEDGSRDWARLDQDELIENDFNRPI